MSTQDAAIEILTERRQVILDSLEHDSMTMEQVFTVCEELGEIETALGMDLPAKALEERKYAEDAEAETHFARYGF